MTTRTRSSADDREPVDVSWPDDEDVEEAPGEGFSVYDHIRPPADGRTARRLVQLMLEAIRLVWAVARRELVVAALLQVAAAAALTVQLLLVRDLLNVLVPAHGHTASLGSSLPYLIPLVVTSALIAFATTAQTEQTLLIGELVGRRACADVAAVSAAVDLEAFERPAFHDRLERAHFNAANRNMSAVNSLLGLLGAAMSAVGVFVALIAIQPLVAPLTVLAIVPAWIISMRNSGRLHEFQTAMTPLDRERRYLLSALSGLEFAKEIRAFDVGPLLRRRHDDLYTRRVVALRRLIATRLRRSFVADALGAVITGGTLVMLLWLIDRGNVSVASAGTAVFAVIFLVQRLRAMVGFAGRLYEASLFLEDVSGFIELQPQVEAARPRGSAPSGFERLVVEGLTFTYPGARQPSIRDVSFEIDRGEIVALVGENGCGKTTLAKQLAALHVPTSGRILWDGTDVATCDPYALRRAIAVIFQDFVHWALPARDNIGIGDADAIDDVERILLAARDAQAHDFLSKLPAGYDTVLSRMFSGGRDLSIGQWQRVALARAFFRDAPFVVMDEPTAALDPLAEYRIFESIRHAFRGRTVLFISHRFSSVRLADRIFVMHGGELIEQGTHEELMAAAGRYARMFTLQASAYLDYEMP